MGHVNFNGIDLGGIMKLEEIDEALVTRIASSLSAGQTLTMMIRGNLELGKLRLENWKDEKSFYLFKCPVHGYQVSYPLGYDEVLQCIPCLREELGLEEREDKVQVSPIAGKDTSGPPTRDIK